MCLRMLTVMLTKKMTQKNLYNKPRRDLQATRETEKIRDWEKPLIVLVPMLVHGKCLTGLDNVVLCRVKWDWTAVALPDLPYQRLLLEASSSWTGLIFAIVKMYAVYDTYFSPAFICGVFLLVAV